MSEIPHGSARIRATSHNGGFKGLHCLLVLIFFVKSWVLVLEGSGLMTITKVHIPVIVGCAVISHKVCH